MQDKVSVIITTYGGKKCVERAVQSCLEQTYENIEIIVVDDSGAGTDSQRITKTILQPYINAQKITYIPHEKNLNASAARNTGVKHASGKYISLLDDDDEYKREKIEKQVAAFESISADYGVVYCSMHDVVGSVTYEYQAASRGDVLYKFLMMQVSACTSNIMIKKSVYKQVNGFDVNFRRHQDWEFLARVAAVSKFYGIPYVGTVKHTQNVVKRYSASEAETFRLPYINLLQELIGNLSRTQQRDILAHEYNELAKLFMREKNIYKVVCYVKLSGKPGQFIKALIYKPLKVIREKVIQNRHDKIILVR